jgi:hypothetical protein
MTASQMLRSDLAHELTCIDAMTALERGRVPFLIGGTFAFSYLTDQHRTTKDLDIMIAADHVPAAFDALASAGFETSLPFPHWLAKAARDPFIVDLIFASGNGVARVDAEWFHHAERAELFGQRVLVTPPEELLWSKAFVMERERFDGADIAHLLWARGHTLDWDRLERRFGDLLPVLFLHVVQFLFAFSDGWQRLPPGVVDRLQARARTLLERTEGPRVCRGTLISRKQYLDDVAAREYLDGRIVLGAMSPEDVEIWTDAIDAPSKA